MHNLPQAELLIVPQAYARAKAQSSFIESCVKLAKSIALIQLDVVFALWTFSRLLLTRVFPESYHTDIIHALIFMCINSTFHIVPQLWFSFYNTFVIEEKFGFNKTTIQTWTLDNIKLYTLSYVVRLITGFGMLKIIEYAGDSFFYFLWIFLSAFMLLVNTLNPIIIMPMFNKFTPLEPGPLRQSVEDLTSKLRFPLADLKVMDAGRRSSHSNALFTGFPWKKHIIVYDTLLSQNSDEEVLAVIAHELGHWKGGHVWKLLLSAEFHIFYMYALFSIFIKNASFYEEFGFSHETPIAAGYELYSLILSCIIPFVLFITYGFSRSFEYDAGRQTLFQSRVTFLVALHRE